MDAGAPHFAISCPHCPLGGPWIRHGRFYRRSDKKMILRFKCLSCFRTFSQASFEPEFKQKKRQYNETIFTLLCSGVSQRRLSLALGLHRNSIARKLKFLAIQARLEQTRDQFRYLENPIGRVQFDEMETHEHTKLKPLSIALAVCEEKRKILGFKVAVMPAKGHLAKKSREKYGPRIDERAQAMRLLFHELDPLLTESPVLTSDQNPKYPIWLKPRKWQHTQIKGRRGCVVGQGELKKIGFDPLFSLNHTCAMIRANVNRLFRKTWCTTKKIDALSDHLWLYMSFHNRVLT